MSVFASYIYLGTMSLVSSDFSILQVTDSVVKNVLQIYKSDIYEHGSLKLN